MEITYGNPFRQYQSLQSEINDVIQDCINRSAFIGGYYHNKFEEQMAAYHNKSCALVASGTAAQQLSLLACGIGPGDEVIVPSMTFFSTAETVSQVGATPVFCDINLTDYCIDIQHLESLITANTKAIMPVDLYGQQCDYHNLRQLCNFYNLFLIQDSAQSFGSKYHDQKVGASADLAIHSFYPGKNLDCMGDAGAVTGDEKLVDRIKYLRNHCRSSESKYTHYGIGWNHRCDGIQAAILSVKINYIDQFNEQRRINAEFYNNKLRDLDIVLPKANTHNLHVYNQYAILHKDRQMIADFLLQKGIHTGMQFPLGCHQQPAYYSSTANLPVSEHVAAQCLSLPVWPGMTETELDYVSTSLSEYFE